MKTVLRIMWTAVAVLVVVFCVVGLVAASIMDGVFPIDAPDWTVFALFWAPIVAIWAVVLRYGVSLKWPLAALLVLLLLWFGGRAVGVVGLIGLGKLIIGSLGRRNVFASSRLAATGIGVSPRGLVE